jgi:excisionase family DNA binding protein
MNEALLLEIKQGLDELNEKMELAHRVVFNSKQAANYLSIGYYTVLQLARIGDLEHIKNGTNYIFRKEHLDRWLDKQERRSKQ